MPAHLWRFACLYICSTLAPLAIATCALASAQTAAFTWQGVLKNAGSPMNGSVDVQFKLFDAAAAGTQVGSTLALNAVAVTNGLFSASLDFGALAFDGNERWLEIAIASPASGGAGPFTTLSPRQKLASVPYAAYALNVALGGSYAAAVDFSNPANAFAGSGAGLTGLNAVNITTGRLDAARMPNGGLWSLASDLNIDSATLVVDRTNDRIGIGQATPGASLHILDSGLGVSQILEQTGIGNTVELYLRSDASGGQSVVFWDAGDPQPDIDIGTVASSDDLRLRMGGITRMSITPAGDVGLGTLTPEAPVHVFDGSAGTITAGSSSSVVLERNAANFLSILAPDSAESGVLFGNPTNGSAAGGVIFNSPNTLDGLQFRTDTNDTQMVITSAGTVGVGTTTPANRLDIEGGAAIGATYSGTSVAPANGLIVEGNVGLGTTTPTARLHVNGSAVIESIATVNNHLGVNGSLSVSGTSGDAISLHAGNASASQASGNVVIAAGSVTSPPMVYGGDVYIRGGSNNQPGGSGGEVILQGGTYLDTFGATQTTAVRVRASTNSGDSTLMLESFDPTGGSSILLYTPGTRFIRFLDEDSINEAKITHTDSTGALEIDSGSASVRLAPAGRVGINRTPAANDLEVEGTASKTTSGSWAANSDRRIKTDIETVSSALDTLDRVRLVSFRYTPQYLKAHSTIEDRRYLNVIAQEFAQVFPEHVKGSGEFLPSGEEILQVDIHPLTIYSAAAIQELRADARRRDREIDSLREEVESLRAMLQQVVEREARRE